MNQDQIFARLVRLTIAFAVLSCLVSAPAFAAATIQIVNLDAGTGLGFDDPAPAAPVGGNPGTTIGQQRLIAFQFAADIWGATLNSNVPISVQATFNPSPPLTCTANSAVLGAAGALQIFGNFAGATFTNTWYHGALANRLAGVDLAPGAPGTNADDIVAFFNNQIDNPTCLGATSWYYGLDNNHGGDIDLVTVLLHEFAHGLGFSNFVNEITGSFIGPPFLPDIYSRFTLDTTAGLTWDQMATNAQRAASTINTNRVVWNGPDVTAAAPGVLTPGTPLLTVTSPPAIAGTYRIGPAEFGPALSSPGVSGSVVLAADGVGASSDACEPLVNGAAISGNIALVDRGTCSFTIKVANAQAVGATAVIVADNVAGSPPPDLGGVDPTITIPSARISLADGNTIKAQLGAGVSATLGIDLSVLSGADPNGNVLLWAPNPVQPGSSISHWDTIASPNLLMEPAINPDLSHGVDLTMPQLTDIGWTACGNNVLEAPDEVCDGTDLGGATCASQGFTGGTLACSSTCAAFDTSGCYTCRAGTTSGRWNLPIPTGTTPGALRGYIYDGSGTVLYRFVANLVWTGATGGTFSGTLYDGIAPDPDYTVSGTWTYTNTAIATGRFSGQIVDPLGAAVGRIAGSFNDNPSSSITGTFNGKWKICD